MILLSRIIKLKRKSLLLIFSCITQIHKFLQWVKGIYSDLPNHLPKIFEPKPTIRVKDLSEVNIDQLLSETYTTTPIHTEKKLLDGSVVTVIDQYFPGFFPMAYCEMFCLLQNYCYTPIPLFTNI